MFRARFIYVVSWRYNSNMSPWSYLNLVLYLHGRIFVIYFLFSPSFSSKSYHLINTDILVFGTFFANLQLFLYDNVDEES